MRTTTDCPLMEPANFSVERMSCPVKAWNEICGWSIISSGCSPWIVTSVAANCTLLGTPSFSVIRHKNCGGRQRWPGTNLSSQLKHKPCAQRVAISAGVRRLRGRGVAGLVGADGVGRAVLFLKNGLAVLHLSSKSLANPIASCKV